MTTSRNPAGRKLQRKPSLALTQNHIPRHVERKRKPPARFSKGERDFQIEDAYKARKRTPRSADASEMQQATQTITVVVPGPDLAYESDVSSLTDLEDLEDIEDPFEDTADVSHDVYRPAVGEEEQPHLEGGYGVSVSALQESLNALQSRNRILEDEVTRLTKQNTALACATPLVTEVSPADLHEKNEEIKALRRRLARTLDMVELARPLSDWESFAESTGIIYQEMHTLSNYVAYVADPLTCIRVRDIQRLRTDYELSHEVANLLARTIGTVSLLASDSVSAFRALIFGFLQEHVFDALEPWNSFHTDSIMLRHYQEVIEQSISPDAVEKYHRVAVRLAITSRQFKEDFLPSHVETLSTKLLKMFSPFIQRKKVSGQLQRQLRILFRHAVNLRAACYPGKGIRYQLVQFLPNAVYDPETMEAQTDVGGPVHVPADGRPRLIKVCVHGLLKAHSVSETVSGVKLVERLSCPFISEVSSDGQVNLHSTVSLPTQHVRTNLLVYCFAHLPPPHESCRAFLRTALPPGTLETLIAAAQSASTSSLFQTWDAIAIQDPEHKSAVASLAGDQEFIRQAPLFLVFVPNLRRLRNLAEQYNPGQDAQELAGMDMFVMSTIDAALAAQNAAIAAEALGLGVCYVGALRNHAEEVCRLLNLPALAWGVFGMAIGWPDTEDRRSGTRLKPRLPMREVLHLEHWSEEGQEDRVRAYDRALGRFYVEEGKAGRMGWGEFVASKAVPWEQDGRERISGVIERQGFKLK